MRKPALKQLNFTDKKPVVEGLYAYRRNKIYKRNGIELVNVESDHGRLYVVTKKNQRVMSKKPVESLPGQFSFNPYSAG